MTSDFKTVLAVLAAVLALGALTATPALASGEPFVETKPATNIGKTSATLHAIVNPEGSATEYWFEYGATEGYGKTTPAASAGSGTSNVEVSATVTGLTVSGKYHFRIFALNNNGFGIGRDAVFTTIGGLPEFEGPFPNTFTAKTAISRIETVGQQIVECPASSGSGTITGEKSLSVSSGKLVLGNPEGGLIYREHSALLMLTAKGGGNFPEFGCNAGGRTPTVTARGELLCEIGPVNVRTTKFTLKCRQSMGKEEPAEYENGKGGEKVKPLFETRGVESGLELWSWQQSGLETTGVTEITTQKETQLKA